MIKTGALLLQQRNAIQHSLLKSCKQHVIPSNNHNSAPTIRFAHMSDVHVWQPHLFTRSKASVLHFLRHNRLRDYKQIQGYLNIKYNRGPDAYPVPIFQQALEQVMPKEKDQQSPNIDHLLITGDITNISLYDEFARVRQLLNEHFLDRLTPFSLAQAKTLASQPQGNMDEAWRHVSIVPGNHDTYTHESIEKDYFGELFGDCLGTTRDRKSVV